MKRNRSHLLRAKVHNKKREMDHVLPHLVTTSIVEYPPLYTLCLSRLTNKPRKQSLRKLIENKK